MPSQKTQVKSAYYLPYALFVALMIFGEAVTYFSKAQHGLFHDSKYWIMPVQTVACAALLASYWRDYDFGKRLRDWPVWGAGLCVGLVALVIWISPQEVFQAARRTEGFNPAYFASSGWAYWLNLIFRFARLAIIVPLIEELFWRGFVMRWLVHEDFTKVPIGTYRFSAFMLTTLFFMMEHSPIDYAAAFVTGIAYNALAVRTKSLGSCILAHSITNLLLGLYIMRTAQWGFW